MKVDPAPSPPRLHRPATLDHLLKKDAVEQRVTIVTSAEAQERLESALAALDISDEASLPAARDELEAARSAVDEATVTVRLRSMGRLAYERLLDAHPAPPEQIAAAKAKGETPMPYNADTFPPALIAASMVEPELSEADARQLWDEWNGGEASELFMAALTVNTSRRRRA